MKSARSEMSLHIFSGVAAFAAGLLVTESALAGAGNSLADAARRPIAVYTQDSNAFHPGGSAGRLMQRARDHGRIRVIIGLRHVMRMEHTLTSAQIDSQRGTLREMQDALATRVLGSASADGIDRFTVIPFVSLYVTPATLGRLLVDPQVASVEADLDMRPDAISNLDQIHVPYVWGKHSDGTGSVIAVLDTGVFKKHPMLAGKVVSEACYGTNDKADGLSSDCPQHARESTAGGSGANCDPTIDGCEHGTHVASVAAGNSPVLDGVARGAKIIAIKVASLKKPSEGDLELRIKTNDVMKALQRVYELRKTYSIAAVNMSFSLGGMKETAQCDNENTGLSTILDLLRKAGIAPIKSSGNDAFDDGVGFPACISSVIAVGSVTPGDLLAVDSNHSSLVKLLAPGTKIKGAVPPHSFCLHGASDQYCVEDGTSEAAPHVAGAFALLKNVAEGVTAEDVLAALACSGKTVHLRGNGPDDPVEINPPSPRIDLEGAYNFLKNSPSVVRSWTFKNPNDALDWTPFRGGWDVSNGHYVQKPIMTGWIGTTVANCNKSLQVAAGVTRIDPGTTFFSNSGVIVKAALDYTNSTVSGYWIAYNKCPTDSSGVCTGADADPKGQAVFWRLENWNFETSSGGATLLCSEQAKVNVNGFNTVHVASSGSTHKYSLNGKPICTVKDSTFATGPVMAAAYIAAEGGHAYQVDTFSLTAGGTAPQVQAGEDLMDPASYTPKPAPKGMFPGGSRISSSNAH